MVVAGLLAQSRTGEGLKGGDEHHDVTGEEEAPWGRTGADRRRRVSSAMTPGDGWAGQWDIFGGSV